MRFKSRSGTVRLEATDSFGFPNGHICEVGEEWTELHEMFHSHAYAKGLVSEDMIAALKADLEAGKLDVPDTTTPESRMAVVRRVVIGMVEKGDPAEFTAQGKPKMDVLEKLAGFDVTAQERDAVLAEIEKG